MAANYEVLIRENLDNIKMWRAEGFSINQICRKLAISKNTLFLYLRIIPELADAWEFANEKLVREQLEPAIIKQALGGLPYIETTEELNKEGQLVITKRVHKVAYSPMVLKYVLSCLSPEKWGANTLAKDEAKIELSPSLNQYGV